MKKSFPAMNGIAVLVMLLLASPLYSQVSAVGSNLLRIGSGETDGAIGGTLPKRYLEEIANARIFFDNITLGLRYEMDDPSEVGPSFQGLRRRWIEYSKDKLLLQAGDVSALYGRGLAINAFEARPLNYDTWLDGVKGEYEYRWKKEDFDFQPSLGVRAIAGKLAYRDIKDSTHILNVSSRAVNSQIGFFAKKLNLGMSFVQAFTNYPDGQVITSREVNQPEMYLNFITGSVEGFFGFTEMREHLTQVRSKPDSVNTNHTGKAIYGSLSYASENLGLTFEYKNYSYNVQPAGAHNETYFSKLPISSPPEVYKDFTYTSITRTTHAVSFDDELGFQIEADITAIPQFVITLNGAASSAHNSYNYDSIGVPPFLPIQNGSASFLPKFTGDAFLPFWEAFAEVERDFGDLNYLKVFAHRRSNVITFAGSTEDVQRSTTVGFKFQYETTKSQSLLASLEHQWMYDTGVNIIGDSGHTSHTFFNELLTVQYSFNPIITFGGVYDFSRDYQSSRHIWPQGFISFRIGGSHTVLASYGAERGGLNCTGGICRVVPAFNGLRVTVTSQI